MTSAGFFDDEALEEEFLVISEKVKTSASCAEASNEDRLRLYGLYKQVFMAFSLLSCCVSTYISKPYSHSQQAIMLYPSYVRKSAIRGSTMVVLTGYKRRYRYSKASRLTRTSAIICNYCKMGGGSQFNNEIHAKATTNFKCVSSKFLA